MFLSIFVAKTNMIFGNNFVAPFRKIVDFKRAGTLMVVRNLRPLKGPSNPCDYGKQTQN